MHIHVLTACAAGVLCMAEAWSTSLSLHSLQPSREVQTVLPMKGDKDVKRWERIDDVIMGGKSSSQMEGSATGATWSGELVMEGGGFCGTRRKVGPSPARMTNRLAHCMSQPLVDCRFSVTAGR